jgi:hypothetical protein
MEQVDEGYQQVPKDNQYNIEKVNQQNNMDIQPNNPSTAPAAPNIHVELEKHDNTLAAPVAQAPRRDNIVISNNLKVILDLIKPFNEKSTEVQTWVQNWNAFIPLTGLQPAQQIL